MKFSSKVGNYLYYSIEIKAASCYTLVARIAQGLPLCRGRSVVRTSGFHPGNRGSIPRHGISLHTENMVSTLLATTGCVCYYCFAQLASKQVGVRMANTEGEEILRIPISEPERLFKHDNKEQINSTYRILAKKWHPDINKNKSSEIVFRHLNSLHESALKKCKQGTWSEPGVLRITDITGKTFVIRHTTTYQNMAGEAYIGPAYLTYLIGKERIEFYDNMMKIIKSSKFADDKMKNEFQKYLPHIKHTSACLADKTLLVLHKPGTIRLSDIVAKDPRILDCKHLAWIISSLLNQLCYFHYTGISHNGISLNSVFIDPAKHQVFILDGWWYSSKLGKELTHLPAKTFDALPFSVKRNKKNCTAIDMYCVKQLGLELAKNDPTTPKEMIEWLSTRPDTPVSDYKNWIECLVKSFGKRRFTPLRITYPDIYGG